MNSIHLPEKIKQLIKTKPYSIDTIGMSDSTVIMLDDMVLKIEDRTEKFDSIVKMTEWLDGRIPVPEIIHYDVSEGKSYLLMSRITGKMACDEYYLENPSEMAGLLAEGLQMLWSIDISDCPREIKLESQLCEARQRVENDLVDVESFDCEAFVKEDFKTPLELLEWLEENQPDYEPVLSHGDYCLPNVFLENGSISGFIDLGSMAIADKYQDIALCFRSLKHNFDGTFGGKVYKDFDPNILFEKLCIKPNEQKIKYYLLLDSLL